LKTVPAKLFRDTAQLKTVDLRINGIESLPEDLFFPAKNLNTLILRQNRLTEIKTHLNRFVPGDNPTIVSYNANVVKIYSAIDRIARFHSKNYFSLI
jgi:hypothetical protein